jgi:hypothetical protein
VLQAVFQSRDLSTDSSGYFCAGLVASIRAMSDASWEVRNSAALTFTELVSRTLGFRNVLAGDSAKRAVTGLEFFNRYPALHPFLLSELQKAAGQLLRHGEAAHRESPEAPLSASVANKIHPSLYPVLVLLSRLKPSPVSSGASAVEADLSPAAFVAVVQQCACSRLLAVRHLAAQAIAPLVAPGDVPGFLASLAADFPRRDALATALSPPRFVVLGHNRLHGIVLQMLHVLSANTHAGGGGTAALAVAELQPVLSECAWLGTDPRVPATLRADFLKLIAASASALASSSAPLLARSDDDLTATLVAAGWAAARRSSEIPPPPLQAQPSAPSSAPPSASSP